MNVAIRRWIKKLGVGLVILIVLTVSAGIVYSFIAKSRLRSVLANIEKDGIPVTWEAYQARYQDMKECLASQSNLIAALNQVAALPPLSEERRKVIPMEGSAKLPEPNQPIPAEMMVAMGERLKEATPALVAVRKAACLTPWWLTSSMTNVGEGACMKLCQVRQATRWQAMSAVYHAENGDIDQSIDAVSAGLQIAAIPHKGSVEIDELVRLACDDMAISSLEYVLCKTSPSAEQFRKLNELLLPYSDMKEGLIGEIIWTRSVYEGMFEMYEVDVQHGWMRWPLVVSGWFTWTEAYQLDLLHRMIGKWSRPWMEMSIRDKPMNAKASGVDFITGMYEDMYLGAKKKELRSHGVRDCARIAVAIKKFSQEHGELPGDLNALSPAYIKELPAEPFTAKPFSYVRDGKKGVISFSVPDAKQTAEFRVYAR